MAIQCLPSVEGIQPIWLNEWNDGDVVLYVFRKILREVTTIVYHQMLIPVMHAFMHFHTLLAIFITFTLSPNLAAYQIRLDTRDIPTRSASFHASSILYIYSVEESIMLMSTILSLQYIYTLYNWRKYHVDEYKVVTTVNIHTLFKKTSCWWI